MANGVDVGERAIMESLADEIFCGGSEQFRRSWDVSVNRDLVVCVLRSCDRYCAVRVMLEGGEFVAMRFNVYGVPYFGSEFVCGVEVPDCVPRLLERVWKWTE